MMNKKGNMTIVAIVAIVTIVTIVTIINGMALWSSSVTPEQAKEQIRQGKYDKIVDVRTIEEWKKRHRPDSISIPIGSFVTDFPKEIPNKDTKVLFVCKKGIRSSAAALMANKMGYRRVEYVEGDHDGLVD